MDSNLRSEEIDDNQLEMMTLAASLCTQISPKDRPNMPSVSSVNQSKLNIINVSHFLFFIKSGCTRSCLKIVKLLSGDEETVKWARSKFSTSEEFKILDGEACSSSNDFQSHLSLALLDTDQEDTTLCQ